MTGAGNQSLWRSRVRSLVLAAAALALMAAVSWLAVPARAQGTPQTTVQTPPAAAGAQPATVHINFVNADLGDVIRSLATALGVNMVLTDVPARRITFQTPQPVAPAQAGAILEGILASQGLILVQNGPVTQVLPDDKRPATGPLRVGKTFPDPAPLGLVTQIVPLDYMRADEAVSLLHDVADKLARVEVVPRSNAILVTDRGVNVARYLDLIRQVDVKTGGEAGLSTYVYPLKHANAAELASTLGQVFGATVAGPAPRARVQALEGKGLSSSLQGLQTRELESVQQRTQIPLETPPVAAQADTVQAAGRVPAGALVGGTTIVPDQSTNSLVIRTAPPNFSVLQGTIEQLDVRPEAQVLLEVLIAEVNLDKSTQVRDQLEQRFRRRGIRRQRQHARHPRWCRPAVTGFGPELTGWRCGASGVDRHHQRARRAAGACATPPTCACCRRRECWRSTTRKRASSSAARCPLPLPASRA